MRWIEAFFAAALKRRMGGDVVFKDADGVSEDMNIKDTPAGLS